MNFDTVFYPVSFTGEGGKKKYVYPQTGSSFVSAREIWKHCIKAAARKAARDSTNNLCIDIDGEGRWRIFQIGGYDPERGLFVDMLDDCGRVVESR